MRNMEWMDVTSMAMEFSQIKRRKEVEGGNQDGAEPKPDDKMKERKGLDK